MKLSLNAFILSLPIFVSSQVANTTNFIKGGTSDAIKIISTYINPIEKAIAYNGTNNHLNIYDSKKEDKFRFGLGINVSAAFINSKDNTYDINELNLSEFEASDPTKTVAQTFSGSENSVPLRTKDSYLVTTTNFPFYESKPILELDSPEGTSIQQIPFTSINGFVEKNGNQLEVRFLPTLTINSADLKVFGFGVSLQHNLGTLIKPLAESWLDIYLSGGYQLNKATYLIDIQPNESLINFASLSANGPYDNQELILTTTSIPLQINFVKTFNHFSFSLGGGYNLMKSDTRLVGNYPVYASDASDNFQVIVTDIKDPFQYQNQFNKMSLNAGLNFQSKHFVVGFVYNYSYYQTMNLNLAVLF